MNKKILKIITIISIFFLMITLCSCQALMDKLKNPEADAAAEQLMKDILNNDLSDVEEVLHPTARAALNGNYNSLIQIRNAINGNFLSFEMISVDIYTHTSNGERSSTYNAVYVLTTTTNNTYNIQTQWLVDNEGKGLTTFRLLAGETNLTPIENSNVGMIIFSIIMGVFAIFSLIVCIKTKMDKKPLFIILIIILFCGITISDINAVYNFRINFLLAYYSQYTYTGTAESFSLNIPLGAIIFWALRKKMKEKYEKHQNAMMALFNLKPPTDSEVPTVVSPEILPVVNNQAENKSLEIKDKTEEISSVIETEDNTKSENK
jgi:hypothetical protein